MKLTELIKLALSNIWGHKLRSFLTITSITVGAFLMFILPSFGLGVMKQTSSDFNGLPLNQLTVSPKYDESASFDFSNFKPPKLKQKLGPDELTTISELPGAKGIRGVSASLVPSKISVEALNKNLKTAGGVESFFNPSAVPPTDVTVTEPGLSPEDLGLEVANGRFFETADRDKNNILISQLVVDGLNVEKPESLLNTSLSLTFIQNDPDQSHEPALKTFKFNIVGVVKKSDKATGFTLAGFSPTVILPLNQALEIIHYQESKNPDFASSYTFGQVELLANSNDEAKTLAKILTEKGYGVQSAQQQIDDLKRSNRYVLLILASIGLIALFVGALNVMNTFTMAVTERTKEIGILRALGTTRKTIRSMFLVEAGLLAFLGSVFGVFWGWIVSLIVNVILAAQLNSGPNSGPALTTFFGYAWWLFLGVIVFIVLVGIVAGIIPAIRASRMKVVEALRYE